MNKEQNSSSSSFIIGLIIGGIIGAVIAIVVRKNNKSEVIDELYKLLRSFLSNLSQPESEPQEIKVKSKPVSKTDTAIPEVEIDLKLVPPSKSKTKPKTFTRK